MGTYHTLDIVLGIDEAVTTVSKLSSLTMPLKRYGVVFEQE